MRKKKCPYCGRRVPYSVCFGRRRKAEFVCPRCGRESRVYISRSVIFAFLICAILSIALFVLWVYLKLTYNPLGIAAVALPLIIFGLISPRFVNFEPLKKYKKTMEAKRAGIAYSDNLAVSELDNEFSGLDSGSGFRINSDVFNQIKADRSASREQISENELSSTSDKVERPIVHVIDDVSEDHAVDNAPLKKLRSDGSRTRNRHYISSEPVNPAPVTDAVYRYGEVNRMIFFHPARVRTCYHCKKSMKPLLRGLFLLAAIYLAVCFGSTIAIVNIFPNATALTVFIVNVCWTVLAFMLRPFFVIFKANEQKKKR